MERVRPGGPLTEAPIKIGNRHYDPFDLPKLLRIDRRPKVLNRIIGRKEMWIGGKEISDVRASELRRWRGMTEEQKMKEKQRLNTDLRDVL